MLLYVEHLIRDTLLPYNTRHLYVEHIKRKGHVPLSQQTPPLKEYDMVTLVSGLSHKPKCTMYYAKYIQDKRQRSGNHLGDCRYGSIRVKLYFICLVVDPIALK